MSSGEDEDAVSVASGGSDADAGSDDAPSVASGDAGSATDGDSDAGSGDMAQERGKTAVEQWADEAGGAAAAAAEAELARQLALLDNPESIRNIATDKTEEKLSHEKARQAAKEVADKALREEEAKKGPPVHRGRPRRKPRALPPPVARAGEILIKRGMLQDMNVEEDQVGTGLVEIVKNAQGKLCIRFDELDIPNPGHHHLAVICWYENYQFGPLVRRYLPVKGRIQQIDEGLNGGLCGSMLRGGNCIQELHVPDPERITAIYIAKPAKFKPNSRQMIIHCWCKLHEFSYSLETEEQKQAVDELVTYVQECQQRKHDERGNLGRAATVEELTSTCVSMKDWLGIRGHEINFDAFWTVIYKGMRLPALKSHARWVFNTVDVKKRGFILDEELGVAVAVTRLALTGPFYTILPVDAFGAIAMRAAGGEGMWIELNRFKGALQMVEASANDESLAKAKEAFDEADTLRKGRLSYDEFMQAWVCTIDVQAELTKRKQPCLEVTRGLPLPQLIQEDRNKLLALLKKDEHDRFMRLQALVSHIMLRVKLPPKVYPERVPDRIIRAEQRENRERWAKEHVRKRREEEEQAKEEARRLEEETQMKTQAEVEEAERKRVREAHRKAIKAITLKELTLERAITQSDQLNHSNEKLREIPTAVYKGGKAIARLRELITMDYSFNYLEVLPDSIIEAREMPDDDDALPRLMRQVRRPHVDPPPKGSSMLYNCLNLQLVDLRNNELKELPRALGDVHSLRVLMLQHNHLQGLPDTVGHLQSLKLLDLSHNRLTSLPNTFGSMTSLVTLRLQCNRLETLPDILVPSNDECNEIDRVRKLQAARDAAKAGGVDHDGQSDAKSAPSVQSGPGSKHRRMSEAGASGGRASGTGASAGAGAGAGAGVGAGAGAGAGAGGNSVASGTATAGRMRHGRASTVASADAGHSQAPSSHRSSLSSQSVESSDESELGSDAGSDVSVASVDTQASEYLRNQESELRGHLAKQGRARKRELIRALKAKLEGARSPDIADVVRKKIQRRRREQKRKLRDLSLAAHTPFGDPHADASLAAEQAALIASDSDDSFSSLDSEERERFRLRNVKKGLAMWYDTHDYRARPKTPPPRPFRVRVGYCLESLTDVNLTQNRLLTLPTWLSGITALKRLDVRWNDIESIPTAVGGFPALSELLLNRNDMAFHGLMQDVPDYEREEFWPEPSAFQALTVMHACQCGIRDMPRAIGHLLNVRWLNLEWNTMRSLPDSIGDLQRLETLNLANNHLRSLPRTVGYLTALRTLNMRGNRLEELPAEVGALCDLLTLNVSMNHLKAVPETMRFMTSLRELDMSFNQVSMLIHDRLHRMVGLRTLDARNNRLSQLPRDFMPPNIQYFTAARNVLTEITPALCGTKHLQHLDLTRNMIKEVPPEISYCTALTTLDLRFNKINGFPLEMAPLFAHPNEGKLRMAVAGNPLLDVEAASGMWTGGVWRPMDVHMPDAQVVQYILEQATMRVVADKVWREEGPFQFPREFTKAIRKYFGGSWHDGLVGVAHTLHTYHRVRDGIDLPAPHADRVNDAERAEVAWYHTNVTMNVRRAEVVRKQRAAADAREEAEEEAKVQAQLDALAEANGGFMQEIKRAVILQKAAKEKKKRQRRREVARRDVLTLRRALPAGEWKSLWDTKLLPKDRPWTSLWAVDSSSDEDDAPVAAKQTHRRPSQPPPPPTQANSAARGAGGGTMPAPPDPQPRSHATDADSTDPMAEVAAARDKLNAAAQRAKDRFRSRVASLSRAMAPRPADLEDMSWQLPVPTKVEALRAKLDANRQVDPAVATPAQGASSSPRDGGGTQGTNTSTPPVPAPPQPAVQATVAGSDGATGVAPNTGPGPQNVIEVETYALRTDEGANKFRGKWGWSRYRHMARPTRQQWDKNMWHPKGAERYREGVERARPKSPGETAIEAVRQAREQMQAMLAKVDARRSGAGHSASTGQPRLAQRGYGMPSSQR